MRRTTALERGSREHYVDAELYDYEYRRRRADVRFYRQLAVEIGRPVLELGCGSGRVALALARAGLDVVGVDLSRAMLARATQRVRRLPRAARSRIELLRADIRRLPVTGRFALIISAFNTLQHIYRAAEFVALLRRLRRQLAPGGCFAFDVLTPDLDWLVRDPRRRWAKTRFTHPSTGKVMYYTTSHTYDPVTQVADIRIYYDPLPGQRAQPKIVRLAHRQFFPQELLTLVEMSGLSVARVFGDFDGSPLQSDSESQVLLTCREEDLPAVRDLASRVAASVG